MLPLECGVLRNKRNDGNALQPREPQNQLSAKESDRDEKGHPERPIIPVEKHIFQLFTLAHIACSVTAALPL